MLSHYCKIYVVTSVRHRAWSLSIAIATHYCRYGKQLYILMQMVHGATVLSYAVISKYVQYFSKIYDRQRDKSYDNNINFPI